MALFALLGVLRGFPAAAYRRTPHRKPLCGLDQDKNCSFLNWALNSFHQEMVSFDPLLGQYWVRNSIYNESPRSFSTKSLSISLRLVERNG